MLENVYSDLLNNLNAGKESVLLTYIESINKKDSSFLNKYLFTRDTVQNESFYVHMQESLNEKVLYSLDSGSLQFFDINEEKILIEPYFPKPRLIILGGGHIAKPLVDFGVKLGFCITVVDDRPSFANANRFPEATQVICDSFENCFKRLNLRKSDFVVIVTRGHRHDDICLRNALNYDLTYIGMIGSKRRVKSMKDTLLKEGYSEEKLDKVNAPIGLDIGAVTPEEIAISIIAEVIRFRRLKSSSPKDKSSIKFRSPEFDDHVLRELAKGENDSKALVTIIYSKGSVPRKAGAKMIVWLDGKTMGSIGGGCSEANITSIARDIILSKSYAIEHIDMTGEIAEEEGMVCGGTMEVLIEYLHGSVINKLSNDPNL